MFEIYFYAFIIILILILIALGVGYYYYYIRCVADKTPGQVCTRDCECNGVGKCGLENAAPGAKKVCCSYGTVQIGGTEYCNSLAVGTPCINNSMCSTNSCINGLCQTSSPTPNPTQNDNWNRHNPFGTFQGPCNTNADCATPLLCGPNSVLANAPKSCCPVFGSPTDPNLFFCSAYEKGTPCGDPRQCGSGVCLNGACA